MAQTSDYEAGGLGAQLSEMIFLADGITTILEGTERIEESFREPDPHVRIISDFFTYLADEASTLESYDIARVRIYDLLRKYDVDFLSQNLALLNTICLKRIRIQNEKKDLENINADLEMDGVILTRQFHEDTVADLSPEVTGEKRVAKDAKQEMINQRDALAESIKKQEKEFNAFLAQNDTLLGTVIYKLEIIKADISSLDTQELSKKKTHAILTLISYLQPLASF